MKKKILICGANGLVGSEIVEEFSKGSSKASYQIIACTRKDADLTDLGQTQKLITKFKPNIVVIAAAKVGGILANSSFPVEFLDENIRISLNTLKVCHENNVDQVLALGSSCIYPRDAAQPMKEEVLLTGALEKTNDAYAIAKIAAIKACQSYREQYGRDYRAIMPTNLYGFNDHFYSDDSHVIPALISRFISAVEENKTSVIVWGSGMPKREFMSAVDMASACRFILEMSAEKFTNLTDGLGFLNVGSGVELSIKDLAVLIAEKTGFKGELIFDKSKPDGTPRKILCCERLNSAGWFAKESIERGIENIILNVSKNK